MVRKKYRPGRGIYSLMGHHGYTNDISKAGEFSENEAVERVEGNPEKYESDLITDELARLIEWLR